jgi:hypothetical protein
MFLIVAKAVRRRQWRAANRAAAQDGNNGLPSAYLRSCGGVVFVIPLSPSTAPEISELHPSFRNVTLPSHPISADLKVSTPRALHGIDLEWLQGKFLDLVLGC